MDVFGFKINYGNVSTGAGRDHVTYRGIKNGKPYTGYASAPSDLELTPEEIISRRYNGNFDDFGGVAPTAVNDEVFKGVEGKNTARGLEQHFYEQDVEQFGKIGKKGVANNQYPAGFHS